MTPKPKPIAAAVYCRISSDPEMARLGVKRQEEDCLKLAKGRGWVVARVYEDNDVFAYNGKMRPQYQAMLEDIEAGRVDAVVAWHLDRLVRQPRELEAFFDTCDQAGLRHMATVSGDIDLSTDDGRLHARILGAMARKASDDTSRRIKRKHQELVENGRIVGGAATPYGYKYSPTTKRMSADPKRARIVREVFRRYARGEGLKQIAAYLNSNHVVGRRGKRHWSTSHVGRMLDNPHYAGFRHHQGELTKGNWKPLIDAETWEKVQALRLSRRAQNRAQNRAGHGNSPLSGILFCECGGAMWRDLATKPHRSNYLCSKSRRKGRGDCTVGQIGAERVEQFVAEAFFERVGAPFAAHVAGVPESALTGSESPDEAEALEKALRSVDSRIERAIALQIEAQGPATGQALRRKLRALEDERAEIERAIAERKAAGMGREQARASLEELRATVADLPALWAAATDQEKNELLRLAVERVKVSGTRPKKINVTWRF